MTDARGLVHEGAGLQLHFADALVLEADPASQDVHDLQLDLVIVPLAYCGVPVAGANDMRDRALGGRPLEPEIAVSEVRPKAVGDE